MDYYDFISHAGVKGQKWGVRRYQNEDGTLTEEGKRHYGYYDRPNGQKDYKRLRKDAANDAKEFARAKAFYGEGAGTRRKQIKNLISERMKDPDYKNEFERMLSQQDMSKHQKAANRERHTKDAVNTTVKTARGVKNFLLGQAVPMTLSAVAIGTALKYTGAGAKIAQYGKRSFSAVKNWVRSRKASGGVFDTSGTFNPYRGGGGGGANAFIDFMNRR